MTHPVPPILCHATSGEAFEGIRRVGHIRQPVWSVDGEDPAAVEYALMHAYDRWGARHSFCAIFFRSVNARKWNIGHAASGRIAFYECILDVPVGHITQVLRIRHYLAGRDPQVVLAAPAMFQAQLASQYAEVTP